MAPTPDDTNNKKQGQDINSLPTPNVVINVDSSSEDEDEVVDSYYGYEQLPQDIADDSLNQDVTSAPLASATGESSTIDTAVLQALEEDDFIVSRNAQLPEKVDEDANERLALWNAPQQNDIQMDKSKEESIMAAMATIKLPQCAEPEWAKALSESDWRTMVREKIQKPDQRGGDGADDKPDSSSNR